MHPEVFDEKTAACLKKLAGKFGYVNRTYLAGGTALALYLGHRKSYDLDFFSQERFSVDKVIGQLKKSFKIEIENTDKDTIIALIDGVRFSLFYYDYPLLAQLKGFSGLKIASVKDIAAMKLAAISQRGARRDFVDVYFILKSYKLKDILGFYQKKYRSVKPNVYNVLKSLTYFEDAKNEVMPQMIKKVEWSEVEDFFVDSVASLMDKIK